MYKINDFSFFREMALSLFAFVATIGGGGWLAVNYFSLVQEDLARGNVFSILQYGVLFFFGVFIIYGNGVYLICRYGYFARLRRYQAREPLLQKGAFPTLTVLIPSYKEEIHVIRRSLLSSALQNYPVSEVVLLIDDPPNPMDVESRVLLEKARSLVVEVQDFIAIPLKRMQRAKADFNKRAKTGCIHIEEEGQRLHDLHQWAATWLEQEGEACKVENHEDITFVSMTFFERADYHRRQALTFLSTKCAEGDVKAEYDNLNALFAVKMSSFERKHYLNLSHAPNKAMNLNSYLALMGKGFVEETTAKGVLLKEVSGSSGQRIFSDSSYVAMLDADTVLSADYVRRLVGEMELPGRERMAVIQTPYSAFPKAPSVLERIAGATTDMQYIVHQGFTHFGATFWVGANALVRKKALLDIATKDWERNFPIVRYIHDRTVIEDTESSVDLVEGGWSLYNYPERLSFSQTPCDFGSLLIQRGRWANGGLIIVPKLLKYWFGGPWNFRKLFEGLLRFHYLSSIAATVFGFLLVSAFPLSSSIGLSASLMVTIPYAWLYTRDLRLRGYKGSDFFLVQILNFLLIPVNLAGVCKSLHQAATGKQIPFARTSKVVDRVVVPAFFVLCEVALVFFFAIKGLCYLSLGTWTLGAVNLGLAFCVAVGCYLFLGIQASLEDLKPLGDSLLGTFSSRKPAFD